MNSNYSSQGYPPQGENMEVKKPDGLCMAGCIVSLVCSGLAMLGLFISAIVFFTGATFADKVINIGPQPYIDPGIIKLTGVGMGIFLIIFCCVQIAPIILCSLVLRGQAKSNIAAGVVSLIFSGLIGGILILVGKYGPVQQPQSIKVE